MVFAPAERICADFLLDAMGRSFALCEPGLRDFSGLNNGAVDVHLGSSPQQ
jgi:hypothetical protein